MYPHSLNPINCAEGGVSPLSKSGQELFRINKYGPLTILPHESLLYSGRYGMDYRPFTIRPSLPYVDEHQRGPIYLGPQNDPFNVPPKVSTR